MPRPLVKESTPQLRVESLKISLDAKVEDAVDGGSAAGQRLDLLDELRRNLIEIGGHFFEVAVDGLNLEFKLCAKFDRARRALL